MTEYQLHPTLRQDTFRIDQTLIADILLVNQALVPWVLIVPNKAYYDSVLQIPETDYQDMMGLVRGVAEVMQSVWHFDKINMASIGNIVPQIHFHVVGRFENDVCFPKPVWGNMPESPYHPLEQQEIVQNLQEKFSLHPKISCFLKQSVDA